MPTGRYLTCVGHCAASWKNFTSFHSTPSMDTEGRGGGGEVQPRPPARVPAAPWGWRPPLTSQHGVLVLGCADEACDPLDDLALGLQVLLLGFLAQEHHWGAVARRDHHQDVPTWPGVGPLSPGLPSPPGSCPASSQLCPPAGSPLPFFSTGCTPKNRRRMRIYLSCSSPW